MRPEPAQYLETHQDALQAGSTFPDWGYPIGFGGQAEDAHWEPFLTAFAQYIHDNYPQPWDEETQKLVVFYLGAVSHSIADLLFHSLQGTKDGFIKAMAMMDFQGDFGAAHDTADVGGLFLVASEENIESWQSWSYYFPIDDILAVYELTGVDYLTYEDVQKGTSLLALGGIAVQIGGYLLADPYIAKTPFLAERNQDYLAGSLVDMATQTHWEWENYLQIIEGAKAPVTGNVARIGNEDEETQVLAQNIQLGLDLLDNGLIQMTTTYTQRGVTYSFEIEPAFLNAQKSTPTSWIPKDVESSVTAVADEIYGNLGNSLAVSDFNNDNVDDLVIGQPGWGYIGAPGVGRVHVLYGSEIENRADTINISEEGADITVTGDVEGGRFGNSVAVVDLNADGFDDLAVSAPTVNSRERQFRGALYIYLGSPTGGLSETPDIHFTASETNTTLGWFLGSGDLNGDGHDDLLVGSPFADGDAGGRQKGHATVFLSSADFAPESISSLADADIRINGETDYHWFGYAMDVAAFPDGSRYLLVGAPGYKRGDLQSVGKLYGFSADSLLTDTTPAQAAFGILGLHEFDKTASGFITGDFIGDGTVSLALASPSFANGAKVFGGEIRLIDTALLEGELDIANLPILTGETGNGRFGRFGWKSASGDINADGIADLCTTAPYMQTQAGRFSGATYLWQGGAGADLTIANAVWELPYDREKSAFGFAVAMPDFNGDGHADLAVSAVRDDTQARNAGRVTILITPVPTLTAVSPDEATPGQTVTATIQGQSLADNKLSALLLLGDTQISATDLTWQSNQELTGIFNLPADLVLGDYDLVLTNAFGTTTLTGSFSVTDSQPDDDDDDDDNDDDDNDNNDDDNNDDEVDGAGNADEKDDDQGCGC